MADIDYIVDIDGDKSQAFFKHIILLWLESDNYEDLACL